MKFILNHTWTEIIFQSLMWWRIVYGGFRVVMGIALLRLVGMPLTELIFKIMGHEIGKHPHEGINHFINSLPFTVTYFLAIYFIFWGLVDIFLSVLLLRHQLWAFPFSIALIVLFILYEMVRYTHTHSNVLLGVIVMDLFIIWMIFREYKKVKGKDLPFPSGLTGRNN